MSWRQWGPLACPCHLHTRSLFFLKNFFKTKMVFSHCSTFQRKDFAPNKLCGSLSSFHFFSFFVLKLSRVCTDRDRGALVCWPKQRDRHNGGSHDLKTKKWRVRIWKKKFFFSSESLRDYWLCIGSRVFLKIDKLRPPSSK